MKKKSIIITSLFIGAAGAIAATLLAPGKGSKTRNKMARKGKLYRDYLVDNFYDAANSVSHPFETLEDETMRLSKKANAKAKEIREKVGQKFV